MKGSGIYKSRNQKSPLESLPGKISLSGDIGSGKSLICKALKEKLHFKIISIGDLHRNLASKYKMTTLEFGKYAETHPEIDIECDNMISELNKKKESLILDSRMAWHFIPDSFKIYFLVDINIAVERIYKDKERNNESYTNIEDAKQKIIERKKNENLRFRKLYSVDFSDIGNHDLVIDTSYSTPEDITNLIIEKFNSCTKGQSFNKFWLSPKLLFPTKNIRELSVRGVKDLIKTINTKGFDEKYTVDILNWDNKYFIFAGHKQTSAAIINSVSLIPVKIITANDELLFNGSTAIEYIKSNCKLKLIYDWEDYHKFKYNKKNLISK